MSSNQACHDFGTGKWRALSRTSSLDYTQKLTTPILAVKLSVSAIIYPRWTATLKMLFHMLFKVLAMVIPKDEWVRVE